MPPGRDDPLVARGARGGMRRMTLAMLALNAACLAYIGQRLAARAHALLPAGGGLHGWGSGDGGGDSGFLGHLESAAESGAQGFLGGGGARKEGPVKGSTGGPAGAPVLPAAADEPEWEWVWEYEGDGSEEEPGEELLRAQARKKKKKSQNGEGGAASEEDAAAGSKGGKKARLKGKKKRRKDERTNSKLPYGGRALNPDTFDPAEVRQAMRVMPDPQVSGKCAALDKSVHVLFSPAPKELHAAVVTAFSAAYNSAKRQELRFHFLLRSHRERVATCRHLRVYQRMFPNLACEGLPPPASAEDGGYMPGCEAPEAVLAPACHCGPQHVLLNFAPERLAAFEGWSSAEIARSAAPFAEEMLGALGIRDRAIFLEPDVVVQGDLRDLWRLATPAPGTAAHVADVCFSRNRDLFNFDSPAVDNILEAKDCALDPGLMVLNLAWLRRENARKHTLELLDKHAWQELWRAGVHQPALMLLIQNTARRVGAEWNVGDLGSDTKLKGAELSKGMALHWKGEHKPWSWAGYYSGKWFKYYLPPARRPPGPRARSKETRHVKETQP